MSGQSTTAEATRVALEGTPARRRVTMTKEGKCHFDSAVNWRQGGDWNFTT